MNPKERRAKQTGKFGVEYSVLRRKTSSPRSTRPKWRFASRPRWTSPAAWPPRSCSRRSLQIAVAKAVEEQARKKFATPIGVWTPIDKEKLPKLPGIEALNPVTSLEPVKTPATLTCQGTQARRAGGRRIRDQGRPPGDARRPRHEGQDAGAAQGGPATARRAWRSCRPCPPGGLRTTTKVVLLSLDRFIREFAAVEDEGNRYDEVENIPVTTYNGAAGAEPRRRAAAGLPHAAQRGRRPRPGERQDAQDALRRGRSEERFAIGTVRAKDSVEALLRVYAIEKAPIARVPRTGDGGRFRSGWSASCATSARSLTPRRPTCSSSWACRPTRSRRFTARRRPRRTRTSKEICRECGGVGYLGQTAIFELLVVDDLMRKTLAATPKLDVLRAAARKSGMKSLQEEGIFMVVRGATSLPELMRVLKGEKQ